MEQVKHTPGPWRVTSDLAAMRAPHNMVVATFDCLGQHKHIICTGVTAANARLIAQAPDLLAERDRLREINKELLGLCKDALSYMNSMEPCGDLETRLETAIAKAEGA